MRTYYILCLALLCLFPTAVAQTAPPAAQPGLTQTIRGTIRDNASKTPIPGATVAVLTTSPLKGSSTDADGNFRIEGVPVGRHTLRIASIGYEEQVIPEMLVGSGKEIVLTIGLTESLVQMQEIVVSAAEQDKGTPRNEMATLSARSISVEESKRYAAAINDIARAATSFAGVASPEGTSNEIIIRGNSPRGLLWRLEGVEVPNPNHFGEEGASGGGVSILSVNMLDNSDFLTGAFPADYGNALSGVFDIKLRSGNNEKREYAFQAGIMGIDFAAEGPLAKGSRGSYLVNYRYSTLAILNQIGVKLAGDAAPDFQDLSFKINLPTAKRGSFSLWGIGGLSNQREAAQTDSTRWESRYDRYGYTYLYNMGAVGLTHTLPLDSRTYLESILSYSGYRSGYRSDSLDNDLTAVRNNRDSFTNAAFRASVQLNRKLNARHTVRTGLIYSALAFNLYSEARDEDSDNQLVRQLDNRGNSGSMQAYGQWKYRITQNLTLNSGVHVLHFALNGNTSVEPRAGIKWQFSPRQSVGAAFGVHSRLESISTYFAQTPLADGSYAQPNRDLALTKASHYVLSYDHQLRDDLRLKVETYYQQLLDVPISTDPTSATSALNAEGGFTTDTLASGGKGRNYGLEMTLEKNFTNNFYFLATGSLFNSLYTGADGIERSTRFNGNFITNLTAGKEFKVGRNKNNLIGANLRWTWAGGNRYSPVDLEASRAEGEAVYVESQRYSLQNPDYYRLDLRVSYRKNRPKASHILSLDLQNATNRLNPFNQYYDEEKGRVETSYHTGLIPILNYRIEF